MLLIRNVRVALCALLVAAPACDDETIVGLDTEPEIGSFVDLMNAHRVTVGCEPLAWNVEVAAVAQAHSVDMVDRDYFAHTNPDGDSPFDRMGAAGISMSRGAENIAWGYPTGADVLRGWLDSPGHRANIENCSLTEHGVGLYETRWTHLFRTP